MTVEVLCGIRQSEERMETGYDGRRAEGAWGMGPVSATREDRCTLPSEPCEILCYKASVSCNETQIQLMREIPSMVTIH
jgi:hypothetical protein